MTIRESLYQAQQMLQKASVPDPRMDAELMLCHVAQMDRMTLLMSSATELTNEQEQRFSSLLLSRTKRTPVQYLLGTQAFYGRMFQVDERVLIPRQETEELCEYGLSHLQKAAHPSVLDLCTGSGAIAVTLKCECPSAQVVASDLSADALTIARRNAQLNHADIVFCQGDLWQPLEGRIFDLILSNPPYIPSADCTSLQQEVLLEPRMALDGGKDGLDFYRRIACDAADHLTQRGLLVVEVGIHQASDVAALFESAGLCGVSVRKDLYGVERIVSAKRRDAHVGQIYPNGRPL